MEIVSEHRDGEITVFVNSETPEIQLTTRREEAKATVNENSLPIVVVAENIESVKDAAKYVDTFDDVIASLPQIMEAATAAQRAEKAEEGATEAKDLSVESAAVASASASSATLSAQKASESETKALASEQSALNSANSASASKTAAQNSALAAAESASSAKQDLASIKADAEMVAEYAPKAIQAAESAENAKASAISAADRAENASQSVGVALEGKQDKLTAGEGIKIEGNVISTEASLPDNVYTEDNLIGGKDIEIIPEPVEGGIDEHTVACWHFDGKTTDEVNNIDAKPSSGINSVFKFGEGSASGNWGLNSLPFTVSSNESFSFDFWVYRPYNSWNFQVGFIGNNYLFNVYGFGGNKYGEFGVGVFKNATQAINTTATIEAMKWTHIYCHFDSKTKTFASFVDGKIAFSEVNETTFYNEKTWYVGGLSYIDELRISKCIRWTEDFEPPTQPYRKAEPTGNYVVNFTGEVGGSGKNIGEVYYSQSSLASDNAGALPLFTGETIASANTIYPDFYSWVESHTELQTTAEEYETALSTYGECPKYVVSNGSLRLPKLVHYVKMANAAEGITQSEAGLPNITGYASPRKDGYAGGGLADGAFWLTSDTASAGHGAGETGPGVRINFDASRSSEVYGKSDTVTPAHTTLYPWVYAFSASVPASTAQAVEFQQGLSGKVDLPVGVDNSAVDYVAESYSDGTNWYRVYKSGWIEQGGVTSVLSGDGTVTLLKPFDSANYSILATIQEPSAVGQIHIRAKTETSFIIYTSASCNRSWYASGKGA